jgi:hypothetical protein
LAYVNKPNPYVIVETKEEDDENSFQEKIGNDG